MKTILRITQSDNGILVIWLSGDDAESKLFSYEKLVEMNINIGDLLNHPEYYGVTDDGSEVKRTDFCKPKLHTKCE
ncbi:hypothetical protein [Methanolacinia petrolearia]|uniref:hypothetical protein n=1 Tax=Methanolacinia petrolearia TaxID=54120 RepID=UPI003BAAA1BA